MSRRTGLAARADSHPGADTVLRMGGLCWNELQPGDVAIRDPIRLDADTGLVISPRRHVAGYLLNQFSVDTFDAIGASRHTGIALAATFGQLGEHIFVCAIEGVMGRRRLQPGLYEHITSVRFRASGRLSRRSARSIRFS